MKKTSAKKKILSADEIAAMADRGEDVSRFFTNNGKMVYPEAVQRVNVDFTLEMLEEIDAIVRKLNISRQAVIKMWLRQALDQHYQANAIRTRGGKGAEVKIDRV